ncbi:phage integrase [Calothrix sp. PCC 7716]|nr:phage integrase [Calothrix sp. PCC 7716]
MAHFKEELQKLNARLKSAKLKVAVFERDNHLWLRATLPPKPGSGKQQPSQERVSLGAKATAAGLRHAEQKAKQMSVEIDSGKFDWSNWVEVKAPSVETKTIGKWIEEYHEYRLLVSKVAPSTWKSDYVLISKKLPSDKKLSIETLIETIKTTPPDTRVRKRLTEYCGRLAEFAKLPNEKIKEIRKLAGNYSAKSVNPRALPSDAEIVKFINSIKNPAWQWLIATIATFGLRSHEAFHLEIIASKNEVLKGKTGARVIRPLYPEWMEAWKLSEIKLPNINTELDNGKLSSKVSGWFADNKAPFRALDLRHCYARRCFEFNLAPDRAAKMMGHSLQVHLTTYRAWLGEEPYDKAYKIAIEAPNRPLPPSVDG